MPLTLAILSLRTDPAWRARHGGDWTLITKVEGLLARAEKSSELLHLGRIAEHRLHGSVASAGKPPLLSHADGEVVTELILTLARFRHGDRPLARLEELSERVGWDLLDLAHAVFRSTRSVGALALMHRPTIDPMKAPYGLDGDIESELLVTSMTVHTPIGRRLLKTWLADTWGEAGAADVERCGEYLLRLEEPRAGTALQEAAQEAHTLPPHLADHIRANGAATRALRASHLPLIQDVQPPPRRLARWKAL